MLAEADRAALARRLTAMGFRSLQLDRMSLGQKAAALSRAATLVLECGSSLANAMLLPRGTTLILLCMREHTSSAGCFGQMLASRFTRAAVVTLRVGEPVIDPTTGRAPRQSKINLQHNVLPHSPWSVGDVTQTIRVIAGLMRTSDGIRRPAIPAVPRCDAGKVLPTPRPLTPMETAPSPVRADWWKHPEEAFFPSSPRALTPIRRSRIFALSPCDDELPRCWELAQTGATLRWRVCPSLHAHCTRWRWCTSPRPNWTAPASDGAARDEDLDRNIDCEQRHATSAL